jgi:hypothetical protein
MTLGELSGPNLRRAPECLDAGQWVANTP